MRNNRILRNLYIIILLISTFMIAIYPNPSFFSWIVVFIILILVGILDSLRTIYNDYHSGQVGKETRSRDMVIN